MWVEAYQRDPMGWTQVSNLSAADMLSRMTHVTVAVLSVIGCLTASLAFTHQVSAAHIHPIPHCDRQKCLQALSMALKGRNLLVESHWTKLRTLNIILGYRLLRLGDMVRYTFNLGCFRLGSQHKDSQSGYFNHLRKRLRVTVEILKKGCSCYSNSKTQIQINI